MSHNSRGRFSTPRLLIGVVLVVVGAFLFAGQVMPAVLAARP